jgi:hypothetical protein
MADRHLEKARISPLFLTGEASVFAVAGYEPYYHPAYSPRVKLSNDTPSRCGGAVR